MKKLFALFLTFSMLFGIVGCGQTNEPPAADSSTEGGEVVVVMPKLTANSVFQEASLGPGSVLRISTLL